MRFEREELPCGYSVPQVAARYKVCQETVRNWIRTGQLRAINVNSLQCGRPRFVVLPEALAEFEKGKTVPTPPPPKRRKKVPRGKDFYPD